MKTALFDFDLPEARIATHPATPRDAARMLVVGPPLRDEHVRNLPHFLKPGDVLVFNDSKVIPARLMGKRGEATIEVLLHKRLRSGGGLHWQCFARPAKKLRTGDRIDFAEDFHATVIEKLESGEVALAFGNDLHEKLQRYGHMPLPPYIQQARKRRPAGLPAMSSVPCEAQTGRSGDIINYQTVYARHEGSVAAPTAGLHFTSALLEAIDAAGARRTHVTLHVGGGTFLPVKSDDTQGHVMHSEYAQVSEETADAVNRARETGGRVIAVGTTSLRTLESAADDKGVLYPFTGDTDIFITPGYRFKIVDMLLTNFHLPRSTLFMLACAFSGLEHVQAAYVHAIARNYRFYSYGDACLLYKSS